jgi:hypothetical protein
MQLIINYLVSQIYVIRSIYLKLSVNETSGFVYMCTYIRKNQISYFKHFTGSKDGHNVNLFRDCLYQIGSFD